MQPFPFYLDWIISGQFVGLCWAYRRGLYAQSGVDVELIWSEEGRTIVDKVVSGEICAGSSEDNLIVSGIAAGKRIKAVAGMLQQSPLVLMTKRSTGIQSLADLPGRRVAMHADGIRILDAVLALAGIDRATIDLHEVNFDIANLVDDRYDAVQGYAMTEPIELAEQGIDVCLVPVRHPLLHAYAQVIFTSEECIAQAPEALRAFLAASFAGWREAMLHRDEAAEIVAEMAGAEASVATERHVLDALSSFVSGEIGMERFGVMDLARWQRNLDAYARFEITPRRMTVAEVVDHRFLDEIYGGQQC